MCGLMTRVLLALKHSGREQSDFARNYECNSYIPKSFPSRGILQEQSSSAWGWRFKKLSDFLLKPTVCVSVSGTVSIIYHSITHDYSTETNEVRLLAVLSTKTISQILFDGAGKQLGVLGHKACHLPRLIAISLEISAGGWDGYKDIMEGMSQCQKRVGRRTKFEKRTGSRSIPQTSCKFIQKVPAAFKEPQHCRTLLEESNFVSWVGSNRNVTPLARHYTTVTLSNYSF